VVAATDLRETPERRRRRRRVRRMTVIVLALAVVAGALSIPLPYVALSPAPPIDALGPGPGGRPLIEVQGHPTYPSAGRLDVTIVAVRGGPGPTMTVLNYLRARLSSDTDIYPENKFLAEDARDRRDREQSLARMAETERRATALALASLHLDPTSVHVEIDMAHTGGGSAGLMLTLGLFDKLTPFDYTGGLHIAGTGAIDAVGHVLEIGGIRQKMIGARRAGATVFLTPAANCAEALKARPKGLRLVRVESVDQAVQALLALIAKQPVTGC
jgi:PDZ domain-containing protein